MVWIKIIHNLFSNHIVWIQIVQNQHNVPVPGTTQLENI